MGRHAGFAFKKTENQAIVSNNKISRKSHIHLDTKRKEVKAIEKLPLFDATRLEKMTPVESLQVLHATLGGLKGFRELIEKTRNPKISEIRSRSQDIFGMDKTVNGGLNMDNRLLETEEKNFLGRSRILETLHPGIGIKKPAEDGVWVPGDHSRNKQRKKRAIRLHSMEGSLLRSFAMTSSKNWTDMVLHALLINSI